MKTKKKTKSTPLGFEEVFECEYCGNKVKKQQKKSIQLYDSLLKTVCSQCSKTPTDYIDEDDADAF